MPTTKKSPARPAWLMALALLTWGTGCVGPDHEGAIRQRFQLAAGHLSRGEVDACVPLIDPLYVRAQGQGAVKFRLNLLSGVFRIGQFTEADVRLDQVRLAPDKKTAEVLYSLRDKKTDGWKPQAALKWVLSDKEWYWSF